MSWVKDKGLRVLSRRVNLGLPTSTVLMLARLDPPLHPSIIMYRFVLSTMRAVYIFRQWFYYVRLLRAIAARAAHRPFAPARR